MGKLILFALLIVLSLSCCDAQSSLLQTIISSYLSRSPDDCSDSCRDSAGIFCLNIVKSECTYLFGSTSQQISKAMMYREICALTCGVCTACSTKPSNCRREPCVDTNPLFCPAVKALNLCDYEAQYETVRDGCKKTCGLCADECSFPPLTCTSDCRDDVAECPNYAARGFCNIDLGYPDVLSNCQRSCGVCKRCLPVSKSKNETTDPFNLVS